MVIRRICRKQQLLKWFSLGCEIGDGFRKEDFHFILAPLFDLIFDPVQVLV